MYSLLIIFNISVTFTCLTVYQIFGQENSNVNHSLLSVKISSCVLTRMNLLASWFSSIPRTVCLTFSVSVAFQSVTIITGVLASLTIPSDVYPAPLFHTTVLKVI